jgi:hypothetical protein
LSLTDDLDVTLKRHGRRACQSRFCLQQRAVHRSRAARSTRAVRVTSMTAERASTPAGPPAAPPAGTATRVVAVRPRTWVLA